MATGSGSGPDHLSLFAKLVKAPETHHVFQALRVIEATYTKAPRFGESRRPGEDPVRLGQDPELAFPPSTVSSFMPGHGGVPGKFRNRFFGFFGPHGPLPLHLTTYARDRQRNHRDSTFVGFADMLTHRFMSTLYRAWAKSRPAPNFDRGDDPFDQKIAALAGHFGPAMRDRDAMPDLARRHFAGHLSMGPKNAEGLIAILSSFFDVPVHVQQFVGTWLDLEPDDTWQLGGPARLGQNTSIGTRVWSRACKFRLIIGPLRIADYERLLPGSDGLERLTAIVRNYMGDALEWDVNLILAGDDVPRAKLGGQTRLGHTSWVKTRDDGDGPRPDAADLYVYPQI